MTLPTTAGTAGIDDAEDTYRVAIRHSGEDEIEEGADWSELAVEANYTKHDIQKVMEQGQTITHLKCTHDELPEFIEDLAPKLKHLDVSELYHTYKPVDIGWQTGLSQLVNLETLNLSGNYLTEIPESVCSLISLKELNIGKCGLKTLPASISKLVNLERLNVRDNDSLTEIPESVCSLISLKELNIANCGLKKLPASFSNLVNLEKLDMGGNHLPEIPESVCSLISLKELDVRRCGLETIPASFSKLVNLETLAMWENEDLREIPESVCSLISLKELNIAECDLKKLPASFSSLVNLEKLDVRDNRLPEIPESMCSLISLKELYIANCGLQNIPASFSKLVNLEKLDMYWNEDLTEIPESVCSLISLKELYIGKCDLKTLPASLSKLVNLEILDTEDNPLTQIPESVCSLISLKELDIRLCGLEKLPVSLKNLKQLHTLDLRDNNITSLDKDLVRLPELKSIRLEGCEQLVSPPYEIWEQGLAAIRQYYADMDKGKGKNIPIAVVAVIGQSRAGKTSFIKTLQNCKARKRVLTYRGPDEARDEATKVFNIEKVNTGNTILRFIDVGGHDIYQLAYQYTLRRNCMPVTVINIHELKRFSEDSEVGVTETVRSLGFDWLSHLYIGCPKLGPPKLIFTHRDMLTDEEYVRLRALFLHTMENLKAELILDENKLDSSFVQIAHLSNPDLPVFAEKDIFVIGISDNYQPFEEILQVLEETCMQFSQEIPDSWERVGEVLEEEGGCCIDIASLRALVKKHNIEFNRVEKDARSTDPLEMVLGYLHECGRILWYKDIPSLRKYIFHKISSVTKLISVLFNHKDDVVWKERLKTFKPFKSHDGVKIEKDYYQELVGDFQRNGVMDNILLHHLIQQESEFKSNESLQVAIQLLGTFRLLHGPVDHHEASCYILPYFCQGFQSTTLLIQEQLLNLKADLKFNGLSLPRYVYPQMTLSLLEKFPDQSDQAVVKQNGITVYHNTTNIRLTHDSNTRTVSIQVLSDLESIEKTWRLFVSIINNAIDETLKIWKAARPSCVFYCPHCLLKGTQHPKKTINPSWSSLSPKYKKGKELQTVDGGEVSVCGADRKVLKALLFPCKLNDRGMIRVQSYANELHDAKFEAATKQSAGKGHIPQPAVRPQQAGDGDGISVVSDGFDYLVPVSEEEIDISFRPQRTTNQSVRTLFTDSDQVYKMTSPKRGRAIIVNNMNFVTRADAKRDGSDVDLRNVTRMFYELGFEICKHQDVTAKELLDVVRRESEDDLHEDFGMFALVIMTHGTENDCFYGSDMKTVKLVEICELLAARNFPAMEGKPKLIVVQACGGEKADFGGGGHHIEEKTEPEYNSSNNGTHHGMYKSLNVDDLLIIKSSFESYSSIRNTSHGSLFIRALVATFLKHAAHRDVYTLHEIMQERVRRASMELSLRYPAHNIGGQTVICIKTLTRLRKLYLFPLYDGPRQIYSKDRIRLIEVHGDLDDIEELAGGEIDGAYNTDRMGRIIKQTDIDEIMGGEIDGAYNTDRMGRMIKQTDIDDIMGLESDGAGYATDRVKKKVGTEGVSTSRVRNEARKKAKATTSGSEAKKTEPANASCTCCVM